MNEKIAFSQQTKLALIATLVATTPLTAAAQALEEVVVTARQRAESLQDVPAAITAFTETDIERAGIERAGDFLNLTPGVNLTNAAEVGDTQVSIRGINGARDGETNFAFIVDGILYTNPSSFNREFADVRQIEVLKGPQGAIYGRSASAGAIITTTREPSETFQGSVKGSVGRDDSYFGQFIVSGPILGDELAGRVSVDYRTTDGTWHNNFYDKDIVDDFENYNVNGRMVWTPNDRLKADAKFRYGEVDAAAIAFNAVFALDVPGFLSPGDVNNHQFAFSPNIDPKNEQETTEFSIKFDYDMDWATATAWMLYSDVEQYFVADGTSGAFGFFFGEATCQASTAALAGFPIQSPTFIGPTPATSLYPPYSPTTCDGGQYQERNQEDISFEIRLTSDDDQRLRWLGGFYFLDIDREVGVAQTADIGGAAENVRSFSDPAIEALVHDDFDTRVYSIFGAIDFDITETLELSFAIRYDREEREVETKVPPPSVRRSNFINYTGGAPGAGGSPLNPAYFDFGTRMERAAVPSREKNFSEIQPKVSLTWDQTDYWTWFASWGVGFKSGGFNNLGASDTVTNLIPTAGLMLNDTYKEETTNNFEVGFKSDFYGGRFKLEGAMFYTEIDDMQFFEFFVGPFGLLRVVTNVDEVAIVGGEIAGSAAVTEHFTAFASGAVVNGEIEKHNLRPTAEGNEVPYAPKWTLNIGGDYVREVFDGIDFVGRVDYRITGDTWFHVLQDDRETADLFAAAFGGVAPPADFSNTKRTDFDVLNLRVGLEGDRWSVAGIVRNAMNQHIIEEVIPAPEFGGSFVHPGQQRTWAIEAQFRF